MNTDHLGLQGLSQVPNLHPLVVHFPIVLLPLALLFYCLGIFARREAFLIAGRWSVSLALVSGAIALWTGNRAASSVAHDGQIHSLMEVHETLGWVVFVGTALVCLWSFFQENSRPNGAPVFLAILLFLNLGVVQQADLGARMVYVYGAGVKPVMSTMEESGHSHEHGSGQETESAEAEHPESGGEPQPSSSPTGATEHAPHGAEGHDH